MKKEQRGFLYVEGMGGEEMYDVNERELSKELPDFRNLQKERAEEDNKNAEAEPNGRVKRINVTAALCAVLSALCLIAAVGVMVYFLRI